MACLRTMVNLPNLRPTLRSKRRRKRKRSRRPMLRSTSQCRKKTWQGKPSRRLRNRGRKRRDRLCLTSLNETGVRSRQRSRRKSTARNQLVYLEGAQHYVDSCASLRTSRLRICIRRTGFLKYANNKTRETHTLCDNYYSTECLSDTCHVVPTFNSLNDLAILHHCQELRVRRGLVRSRCP